MKAPLLSAAAFAVACNYPREVDLSSLEAAPFVVDTDGDGLPDLFEGNEGILEKIHLGTSGPSVAEINKEKVGFNCRFPEMVLGLDAHSADTDGDGSSDAEELNIALGDGLWLHDYDLWGEGDDYRYVVHRELVGPHPRNSTSSWDKCYDNVEFIHASPLIDDSDGDSMLDSEDPYPWFTDGDRDGAPDSVDVEPKVADSWHVLYALADATDAEDQGFRQEIWDRFRREKISFDQFEEPAGDLDGDLVPNYVEVIAGSDPRNALEVRGLTQERIDELLQHSYAGRLSLEYLEGREF